MSSISNNCTNCNTNPMYYITSSEFKINDFSINFVVAKFGNVLVKIRDYLTLHSQNKLSTEIIDVIAHVITRDTEVHAVLDWYSVVKRKQAISL